MKVLNDTFNQHINTVFKDKYNIVIKGMPDVSYIGRFV